MPDNPRIDDLRRRVEKDPASIAFAQLAEEYRRAGQCKEAVDVCRAGLALHPGYLSARVTLGRALVEVGQLEDAQQELETVLKSAPENLAAIRGLAEIHHRRGSLEDALRHYRTALSLARNDPELEETVRDLERKVAPARPGPPADGLSLEQMQRELTVRLKAAPAAKPITPPHPVPTAEDAKDGSTSSPQAPALGEVEGSSASSAVNEWPNPSVAASDRAVRTVAALEAFLDAVHGARDKRSP
jgi:tetratricopeptide (TPR) repeat protein